MYTLRTFKNAKDIDRLQVSLGGSYQIKSDPEKGIKFRVFSNHKDAPKDGFAIFENQYAFIMSSSGETFETLNKPKLDETVIRNKIKTTFKTVTEIIDSNNNNCPLPLEVIPNKIGINLSAVKGISWSKNKDNLIDLTIHFINK